MAFIEKQHMKGNEYISAIRNYVDYIEEHLEYVRQAFNDLSEICKDLWWVKDDVSWHTLRQEVCHHDLSKFSQEEFIAYQKYFSPVDKKTDEDLEAFKAAWEHHKEHNHHHPETAVTDLDIVHMVIDLTAMGYKFNDTAQEYVESNPDEFQLSDRHNKIMWQILNAIKEAEGS